MKFIDPIKDVFVQLMTSSDGKSHDIGRWSWFLTTGSVTLGAIWNAAAAHSLDLVSFATALSLLVAAHGVALFAKKTTEPEPPNEPPKS